MVNDIVLVNFHFIGVVNSYMIDATTIRVYLVGRCIVGVILGVSKLSSG